MTTEPTPAHGASDSVTATPPAAPPSDATSTAIAEQPAPTPPAPASPAAPTPTAPTIAKEPGPDLSLRIDYLLLAILLVLSFLLASFTASNSDLWTHLATGRLISEGKFEFGVDPFTWTTEQTENAPAVPWIHQSWLFSLLVFQIHESLGGAGLVVIKAILFTLTIGVLSRIGWQSPNRWFLLICLLMATLAASQRALMQPIVVSMLFLAITIYLLYRGGVFALTIAEQQPADTRCLWCLPPLFALWANLDVWFILGPIILGLVWTAAGLARWFGGGQGVPGKTLGIVFGAGVLACLLNPYHVHVFQLPPELAYFVLAIADPLRIPMPAELVAGGRSLKELRSINADVAWTLSSVDADYWWRTQFGKNVAGLAFYPLALLGLMTFVMAALVKSSKGAPSLQFARFLIWLVFAVLALSLYRMIPFFVLIAAPLTAMTLDEFLLWQQKTADIPKERRDRGIKMARIVSRRGRNRPCKRRPRRCRRSSRRAKATTRSTSISSSAT